MTATAPTRVDEVTSQDVELFCNFCVSLRSAFRHFQILFDEGGDLRRELLWTTAPTFFGDLNLALIEHLILQICKITDPEESFGRKNLTVKFFINNSDLSAAPDELEKLIRFGASMTAFRAKIVPARNRLIGHLDRDSVLDGKSLGETDKREWAQFWLELQDFTHFLHKRYIDPAGHFYLNAVGYLSDADSLVKALKESTYFRTLMSDRGLTRACTDVAFNSKYFDA